MTTRTTLVGEMFLLLTTPSGHPDGTVVRRAALSAAALVDLELRGRIRIGEGRDPRIELLDRLSTGESVLDPVVRFLDQSNPPRIYGVITHHGLDLTETVGEEYVRLGAVTRRKGWFSVTWPEADAGPAAAVRSRLAASVRTPAQASRQDASLLELLRAQRIVHRVLREEVAPMTRREVDAVVRGLEVGHPAARSLGWAMAAAQSSAGVVQ